MECLNDSKTVQWNIENTMHHFEHISKNLYDLKNNFSLKKYL